MKDIQNFFDIGQTPSTQILVVQLRNTREGRFVTEKKLATDLRGLNTDQKERALKIELIDHAAFYLCNPRKSVAYFFCG
jgi:hypothetical protein